MYKKKKKGQCGVIKEDARLQQYSFNVTTLCDFSNINPPKQIIRRRLSFSAWKSESRPITLHSDCIHCTDKAFISISILPKDTYPTFFQQCCFYQDSHLISYCCLSSMFSWKLSLYIGTGKVHCINITDFKTKFCFLSTSTYCCFIKDDLQQFQVDSRLFVSSLLYSIIFFYSGL